MTHQIPNRDNWSFGKKLSDIISNKELLIRTHISSMLNKTTQMFEYTNLPSTIKKKDLELQLLCNGFTVWTRVDNEWYTFFAGLGGQPNPYYLPTLAVVANPALKYNASLKIDENCVVMLNDNLYEGILPTLIKYSSLLVEAELTLKYALINARIPMVLTADSDSAYTTATKLIQQVVDGKDYGIVIQTPAKAIFDGINSLDFCKETHIKDVIEAVQYIKGSEYNEIGLNAAFNMKREAINEAEATLNEDILYPLCDTMLECRRDALKLINEKRKKFGEPEITVDFSSAWKKTREYDKISLEKIEAEVDTTKKEENTVEDKGNTDNTTDS